MNGLVCFLLIVLANSSSSRVINQGVLENLLGLTSNTLALIKRQALLHPDTGLNIVSIELPTFVKICNSILRN